MAVLGGGRFLMSEIPLYITHKTHTDNCGASASYDLGIPVLYRPRKPSCCSGVAVLPAASSKSFTAIRKDAGLYCGSRLRSGEVFAYVGSIQNLKDLKHIGLRRDSRYISGRDSVTMNVSTPISS